MKALPLAMATLLTVAACPESAAASRSPSATAHTWTVGADADFPLITPALAVAQDGDTIVVGPGVYRENLVLRRSVSIIGHGSPVVFGLGTGSVIRVQAPGCEIRGLVIEGSGTGDGNEMDAAVQVASSGNRIVGNTMRRVFYGVVIGAPDNEIADNAITGFLDLPFGRRGDGIYVYRAASARVRHNHIVGERDGIYFQYAPDGLAEENVVDASRYGLHVMFANDILIRGNTLRGSSVGANIMDSRRIRIDNNRFERNRGSSAVGLTLKGCDDSVILDNLIVDNARGLQLDGSSRNTLTRNRLLYNDTAVMLFASAEQNEFSSNVFDDNWSDVVVSGGNSRTVWSSGGRGNTWGRYRGFDFDGDGIGESPHPLITPFAALEGANPIARLFLGTPVAVALDLSARAGLAPGSGEQDPRPVVQVATAKRVDSESARESALGLLMLAIAAIAKRQVSQ